MTRNIRVAAVQMDANSAPTTERLARAETLVAQAAADGAQLVVLPELFNLGYKYTNDNHHRAEPFGGETDSWLKQTAQKYNIHLIGTLLLLDGDEIFNSALLYAPDGRLWRYDKNYPWGWERGYFRGRDNIMVAHTDIGRLGFLICWDSGHTQLWQRYAGQVDLMLIPSCPPDVGHPTFHFSNGDEVTFDQMGPIAQTLKGGASHVFHDMINEQTAWLGVPAVVTGGGGQIKTPVPNGIGSLVSYITLNPLLARYLPYANQMQMSCELLPTTKVVAADGTNLIEAPLNTTDTVVVMNVPLADTPPVPNEPQPPTRSAFLAGFSSDVLLPMLTQGIYRDGVREAWGENMAPNEPRPLLWVLGGLLLLAVVLWRRR